MKNFDINEIHPDSKAKAIKINSTLGHIHFFLDKLKAEYNKDEPSFNELKHGCFELIHRLPLPVNQYNSFILRSRPNFNGEIFKNASQISFNPFFEDTAASRFNRKGESAFYGAVPLNNQESYGALTTLLESLKEIFDDNHKIQEQYYTIGKWEMVKPINLFVLTFFEEAMNNSVEVKRINAIFRKHLKSICNKKDQLKCNRFYGYISKFACKLCEDEKEYLLTTAFFHALKNYYGEEIGLLYSSSMTDNKGLNIVLSNNVLLNNYLKLTDVVMYRALRNPNNPLQFNLGPFMIGNADDKGVITFGNEIDDTRFFHTFS